MFTFPARVVVRVRVLRVVVVIVVFPVVLRVVVVVVVIVVIARTIEMAIACVQRVSTSSIDVVDGRCCEDDRRIVAARASVGVRGARVERCAVRGARAFGVRARSTSTTHRARVGVCDPVAEASTIRRR
jgi:hypothetical protein